MLWLQKFALFKKRFPEGSCDRPSGPEVVCSQSLPSRDRQGAVSPRQESGPATSLRSTQGDQNPRVFDRAVQGLSAYNRS